MSVIITNGPFIPKMVENSCVALGLHPPQGSFFGYLYWLLFIRWLSYFTSYQEYLKARLSGKLIGESELLLPFTFEWLEEGQTRSVTRYLLPISIDFQDGQCIVEAINCCEEPDCHANNVQRNAQIRTGKFLTDDLSIRQNKITFWYNPVNGNRSKGAVFHGYVCPKVRVILVNDTVKGTQRPELKLVS